jgi:hypothetical protein
MKQKFKILLTYLKPIKKPISVTWFVYDAEPDWFALLISDNLTVQQNILNIIIEIAEDNWEDVLDNVYSDINNYQYILTIDPINNEIRLNCLVEEDVDSDDYRTYQINDDVFLKYMKDNNITEITCGYNGSGDDGSINDIIVNGEKSDDTKIDEFLYNQLEKTFLGWEMDSGSYGDITIDNEGLITFNHMWMERDWFEDDWEKTLTINNIDDER